MGQRRVVVSCRRAIVRVVVGAVCGLGALQTAAAGEEEMAEGLATAREILEQVPLIDGHNDLPWQIRERFDGQLGRVDLDADLSTLEPPMHTDIPRLRRGGVGANFWSVYVPVSLRGAAAVQATFEQIDLVHRMVETYPEAFELALTAADVERIHGEGRIASLIGVEGGHSIGNSLAMLRRQFAAGARYMTVTHWQNTDWADAATDAPAHDGLTAFGREVIREMNRLGMLVDLSHVSPKTMHAALDVAAAPVIFSHSSARALVDHPRNVPDDVLERLRDNGGVVMVTFVPSFVLEEAWRHWAAAQGKRARLEALHPEDPDQVEKRMEAWRKENPAPRATLARVADHIDHIRAVAGVEHVGIGSDFDGITSVPDGLEDVSTFPDLLAELLRRGYTRDEVAKIAGRNVLRVMRQAEAVAERLQEKSPPSEARIEELDHDT